MRARGAQVTDHRRARRRGRRLGHAADDRSDLARQECRRAADRRDQQDRSAAGQRAEGQAGPARRTASCSRSSAAPRSPHRDLGQEGNERRSAARPDPAAGGDARPQGESRPPGGGNGGRGDARPGQGSGRDGARPERHAQGRRRLHLRHVLGPGARACSTSAASPCKAAGPAIPVQILGFEGVPEAGDQLPVGEGRGRGARYRADAATSRSRGEASPHQRGRNARRLHGGAGGRRRGHAATSSSRPTRAVRRKRSPMRSASCPPPKSRSRSFIAASARSPRATSCSPKPPARSSSASTCGRTTTRAPPPSAKASRSKLPHHLRSGRRRARAMEGMLAPEKREVVLGEAEVREVFKVAQDRHDRRLLRAQRHH